MEKTTTALLISERESIIVRSIEKKLQDMSIETIMDKAKIENVEGHREGSDIFIIYLPDEISEDLMKTLIYIADYAEENAKPLVLIGNIATREALTVRIRRLGDLLLWFDRPLDIEDFGFRVHRALNQQEKQMTMKKILIVDDDPNYAKMVREWLRDIYKVDIVVSGAQCINFLSRSEVDLILLDYEMPVVDGQQVLQMLREDSVTATIPVIFLTGVGKKESVAKVLSLKPQGYILKSTTKNELIVTLRDFFYR